MSDKYFGYGPLNEVVGGYGYEWYRPGNLVTGREIPYTQEQLLSALYASPRRERYRCYVLDTNLIKIGETRMTNMAIDCNAGDRVPTSMAGVMTHEDASKIDWAAHRLQPVLELYMPDGGWAQWPLGVFVPTSPELEYTATGRSAKVEGYDLTVILKEDKFTDTVVVEAGTPYQYAITTLIQQAGIQKVLFDLSDEILREDIIFELGTPRLDAINALLTAIGYMSAYASPGGAIICKRYALPYARTAEHRYEDGQLSVMIPDMSVSLDTFDVPNVIVATVSLPDAPPLVARWVNDNPGSVLSTIRRGRRVVRVDHLGNVADQETLDAYVRAEGYKTVAGQSVVQFSTVLMPGHGVNDILFLRRADAGISGRYVENGWSMDLKPGAQMRHVASRVVLI